MQPATKQHIVGMLTMIRQACHSVEAAIAADQHHDSKSSSKAVNTPDEEDKFLSDEQEELLGELLGLSDKDPEKKVTSQKAKKSNEKLPIS